MLKYLKKDKNGQHQFYLFGYFVGVAWADTIWVANHSCDSGMGTREDFFVKISRIYERGTKIYINKFIVGKFNLMWIKV